MIVARMVFGGATNHGHSVVRSKAAGPFARIRASVSYGGDPRYAGGRFDSTVELEITNPDEISDEILLKTDWEEVDIEVDPDPKDRSKAIFKRVISSDKWPVPLVKAGGGMTEPVVWAEDKP